MQYDNIKSMVKRVIPISAVARDLILNLASESKDVSYIVRDVKKRLDETVTPIDVKQFLVNSKHKLADLRKGASLVAQISNQTLLDKANRVINRSLDRMLDDDAKLEEAKTLYANNDIDLQEYERRVDKLLPADIDQVLKIVEKIDKRIEATMPKGNDQAPIMPGLPSGMNDPVLTASLNKAIAEGNPIEVQRILWGGKTEPAKPSASPNREPIEGAIASPDTPTK